MAGIFGFFDYSKEGPGVSKKGPQKRSFVVFFEIYGRKFWSLLWANLLYVLVSLPVITGGWAEAGLTYITRNYAREKHAFVKEDFFDTIKKNRGQAFLYGMINILLTGILYFNIFYCLSTFLPGLVQALAPEGTEVKPYAPQIMDYVVLVVTAFATILFTWMRFYIPLLVVTFKLKLSQVYKNAFIFSVAGLKQNLIITGTMLGVYALLISMILFIPNMLTMVLAMLMWIFLVPAFRSLLIQYTIFPVVKEWMIDPYYKDNPQADKQARLDLNLDIEEEPAADAPPAEEPVFSDDPLVPETATIPKQYSEREMRGFRRQVQGQNDDDDTI